MHPSTFYHIYNHANDPENLFRSDENYRYFLQQWSKYVEPVADTYAYCQMPNHIHFLIRTKDEIDLRNLPGLEDLSGFISKQFSNLFNSYAKAFNKMYDRRGSLFNRPFKAKEITSDSYLTNVIFYIHHNPIHHGFTTKIEDWPHSSYHALISDKPTRLKRTEVLQWFGSKDAFIKFLNQDFNNLTALEMEYT
jgi:putative transposase